MSEENIKPWEMFGGMNEQGAPESNIKPWDYFAAQRQQGATLRERAAIRDSFAEDPLLCVPAEQRAAIEAILQSDPLGAEEKKKRIALSRYYSMNHPEATDFIFDNLEAAIEQFEGKPMSVEQAYASIAQIYHPKQEKGFLENRAVAAVIEGEGEVAKATFNTAAFLAKLFVWGSNENARAELMAQGLPEAAAMIPSGEKVGKDVENKIRGVYKEHYEPIREWAAENMDLPEDWVTNSDSLGDWLANAGIAIINYTPQLAAQVGLAATGVGATGIGTVYGIGGYYEARDEYGMDEGKALAYGFGIGMINGVLEKITLGIVEGKVSEKVAKEGIKKGLSGFLKHYGFAMAKEGGEEALEEVAENILDMAMGVTDTTNFSESDYIKAMFKGVPEAAFLGAVTGGPLATDSYVNLRQVAEANEEARTKVTTRIKELTDKDSLTEDEEKELSLLNTIEDSGDPMRARQAAIELGIMDEARQAEEEDADAELTDEEREQREIEQEERAAKDAEDAYRFEHRVGWNPQDTVDRVQDVMKQFPAFEYNVVWSADMLPDFAKKELDETGINPNKVQAFIQENTVYVVAENVRPSEVAKVIGHEIIGHRGLRAVLGDDFDRFLDQVYKERAAEIEAYSERYNMPADTVDGQRYLTEEYLADMANADAKPKWWKEFIASIRAYLRKVFPNMHITDGDIEHALIQSARAMRNKRNGSRFSLIGESGAATADENGPSWTGSRVENLKRAEAMEEAGTDPKTIWIETGWERGTDGEWRMEVPDLHIRTSDITSGGNYDALLSFDGRLGEFADAPELFSAYPELRDYRVSMWLLPSSVLGQFDSVNNRIYINQSTLFDNDFEALNRMERDKKAARIQEDADRIDANIKNLLADFEDSIQATLLHEVQHAIQHIEGFSRGGDLSAARNVDFWNDPLQVKLNRELKKIDDRWSELVAKMNEWEEKTGYKEYKAKAFQESLEKLDRKILLRAKEHAKELPGYSEYAQYEEEANELFDQKSELERQLKQAEKPFSVYKRFAGETEARNASQRGVMPAENRLVIPPSETEDVPRNEQIVRFSVAGEDNDLIVIHNLSEQKLRGAIKLGALPVPSIAIVNPDKSDFTDYGRITLIADKSVIDPKNRKSKVYDADVYSPRRPIIERIFSDEEFDRALKIISPYETLEPDSPLSIQHLVKQTMYGAVDRDFEENLKDNDAVKAWYADTRQGEEKFEDWWQRVAAPALDLHPKERIFDGFTNAGNRRYLPANLETIVRLMTKQVKNGEGTHWGFGSYRAAVAKQFKSIAEIQKNRDKIISYDDYVALKDEIQKEIDTLESEMEKAKLEDAYWGWDTANDLLLAFVEGDAEGREFLYDTFGKDNPIYEKMAAFLSKLKGLPSPLFEAKPQRAVYLNEFKAAVVPADTSETILAALRDAGIDVFTYENDAARKATLQFVTKEKDLRFSVDGFSDSDRRNIISMLKPKWRKTAFVEPSQVKAYLEAHGIDEISENDAWSFYHLAGSEIKDADSVRAKERAREQHRRLTDWLYWHDMVWRWVVDELGGSTDIKIRPSYRFFGEEFTGTFIADDWRRLSKKRPQSDNESDKMYLRYLRHREEKLKSLRGGGAASDELAEGIARKTGMDALDVEQQIIDTFRDLTWPELRRRFKEYTDSENYQNAEEEAAAREAYEANREKTEEETREDEINDEAIEIISRGEAITEEWAIEHPEVFRAVYKILMGGEEAPKSKKPSKINLEAVNKALTREVNETSEEETREEKIKTYMAAYKEGREASWAEYRKQLGELRQKVMQNKADAVKLQRAAVEFAEKNLPEEFRGAFTRGIVGLLEYSPSPSRKYPEGRRMHEFKAMQEKITKMGQKKRAESGLANIKEMLDAVKMKRNWKGIPISIVPSEQAHVDRIRKIVDMNAATVANAIDFNNERIAEIEMQLESTELSEEKRNMLKAEAEQHILDNTLLDKFGNIAYFTPEKVKEAETLLKNLIKRGKIDLKTKLGARAAEAEKMRRQAIDDATFGTNYVPDQTDARKHLAYMLKMSSLGNLMRIASGKSIQDFENSVAGELWRKIEDSTQDEQTNMRRLQEDFDAALEEYAGVSGNALTKMRKKGKLLRELKEVSQHSGVYKIEYSRVVKVDGADVLEGQRRKVVHDSVPVDDYEFAGKTMPGARSILRAIDNGEPVYIAGKYGEMRQLFLDDAGVWFLRKQLEDYDAGIKRSYEIFSDQGDQDAYNKLREDEGKDRLMLLSHAENENFTQREVPLSQGSALQILFTWEQEDYRANMKWNGWTEESIAQIKKYLKPETLKLGEWMRNYIAKRRDKLDAAVYERYGAHLPVNENYWPGLFRGTRSVEPGGGMRGAGTMSINPSFLIARKFHLKPLDMDADAFSTFFDNQIQQTHFLAWSEPIRQLREVYGNPRVQKAINDNFGKAVTDEIVEQIASLARNGQIISSDWYNIKMFRDLYRYWVPAKIAVNLSSILKQGIGVLAYSNDMPLVPFVKGLSKANFLNSDFRNFAQWAMKSDYMKNRLSGGMDRDLIYMLSNARDSKTYSPMMDALLSAETWATRRADAWSALHGGYAVYQYAYDQAKKRGLNHAGALAAAERAWMRATDETQQSGYLKDLNYYQQNQGLIRYLTAFRANPIQLMNLELRTLRELKYGENKAAAKKKLARQILVNHIVVPTMMQFVTDMLRYGLDVFDEAEIEDYFIAWLFGPFESGVLYFQIANKLANIAADLAIRHRTNEHAAMNAIPIIEDVERDVSNLVKMAGDDEITVEEAMDGVKAAGDIGMLIGAGYSPAGPIGTALSAGATQAKRLLRLFSGGDDKKKRRK